MKRVTIQVRGAPPSHINWSDTMKDGVYVAILDDKTAAALNEDANLKVIKVVEIF